MKITGIVTEYNPFHNGHQYHIEQTRKLTNPDVLIAVMSGHFVQRGEPAICDKWKRTEIALSHGVDLVIELPIAFSTQSAQTFAYRSVEILSLAQASDIVFGSESNDLKTIQEIAQLNINIDGLKESMRTGNSYPKAIGLLSGEYDPNDILGIGYCKAANHFNMTPHTIQRTNSYHSVETDNPIASATAIRNALKNHQSIAHMTPMHFLKDQSVYPDWQLYYPFLKHILLTLPKSYLQEVFLVSEGIESHMIKQAILVDDANDFINACVNRRYSKARIQRTMVQLLLHHTKKQIKELPPIDTLRILGFNQQGLKALQMYKEKEIKVASRFNQIPLPYRQMEHKATQVYASVFDPKEKDRIISRESQGPVIIL
ncbi:MAG: nucleotidyltransferase [Firmicutes bacterium HGW-Firmicutes-19]|nr:MAG: nucleotidyltransferase [Firmicutes bacterium HGW-Firmicutes-19]